MRSFGDRKVRVFGFYFSHFSCGDSVLSWGKVCSLVCNLLAWSVIWVLHSACECVFSVNRK